MNLKTGQSVPVDHVFVTGLTNVHSISWFVKTRESSVVPTNIKYAVDKTGPSRALKRASL